MQAKNDMVNYVLVCDISDNGQLYYYTGYYKHVPGSYDKSVTAKYGSQKQLSVPTYLPNNSTEYTEAVKSPFKDEAEMLCAKLNENNFSFKYHVEEHMYM